MLFRSSLVSRCTSNMHSSFYNTKHGSCTGKLWFVFRCYHQNGQTLDRLQVFNKSWVHLSRKKRRLKCPLFSTFFKQLHLSQVILMKKLIFSEKKYKIRNNLEIVIMAVLLYWSPVKGTLLCPRASYSHRRVLNTQASQPPCTGLKDL